MTVWWCGGCESRLCGLGLRNLPLLLHSVAVLLFWVHGGWNLASTALPAGACFRAT